VDDTTQTNDSVSVAISSSTEQWYAPGVKFERTATMYPGTSRVKMDETIINQGATAVNWSMWSITQSIVNHPTKRITKIIGAYFPINPNSRYGQSGVFPQGKSNAWKGEVAPGVYGVQFSADNQKIYADPDKVGLPMPIGRIQLCLRKPFRFSEVRNIRTAEPAFPSMSAETALQYIWRLK